MTIQEINKRLQEIAAQLKALGEAISEEDLKKLEDEAASLEAERTSLLARTERRSKLLQTVAGGTGTVVQAFTLPGTPGKETRAADPFDTAEYRNAFMDYVCRGVQIPEAHRAAIAQRASATTSAVDVSAVVPTTLMHELIKQLKQYGGIYEQVRKMNIQGGVEVPILTLLPEAKWVGEGSGDTQKIQANDKVTFSYFGLECKIAQTLLANVVTYEAFQEQFVELATEAVIKKMEQGIFVGTGTGQMLGITKDPRVPADNVLTLTPTDFTKWNEWKKKVFAKMPKAYRNGIFVMAQGTFDGYIDGMVDTTGQPIGRITYGIGNSEEYRFGGKKVETVEEDVIASYDTAATGDVVAAFFDPKNYAINSNMEMQVVKWTDHDTNEVKNKCMLVADGKLLDPYGVLIIKKGGA